MLTKLTDEEKALITIRYGEDLNNPVSTKLSKEQTYNFYGILIPKMKRLLANPTGERKVKTEQSEQVEGKLITKQAESQEQLTESTLDNNGEMTKEDYMKMIELLRTPSFAQMMSTLSVKEAVIISLKLGYIDGKYFSTESIAAFLQIEPSEVIETTKKVLFLYKENINEFLDKAITSITR